MSYFGRPGTLTQGQLDYVISQVPPTDISGKVDKITGHSLIDDLDIAKIHMAGSDNQDLSNLVVKVTGKGLSTNDYSASDQAKLSGLPNITVSAIPPAAPLIGDLWIDTN